MLIPDGSLLKTPAFIVVAMLPVFLTIPYAIGSSAKNHNLYRGMWVSALTICVVYVAAIGGGGLFANWSIGWLLRLTEDTAGTNSIEAWTFTNLQFFALPTIWALAFSFGFRKLKKPGILQNRQKLTTSCVIVLGAVILMIVFQK